MNSFISLLNFLECNGFFSLLLNELPLENLVDMINLYESDLRPFLYMLIDGLTFPLKTS